MKSQRDNPNGNFIRKARRRYLRSIKDFMVRNKMYIVLGSILGTLVIVLLILLISQSAILIRVPNPDSIRGRPLLLVLNPFRDKEPETAAETFFEKLKDGKCLDATAQFAAEKSDRICRKQIEYPLNEWNLIDIETKNNSFELTYKHMSGHPAMSEDMTVWIEKRGQEYSVAHFNIGY